MKTTLSRSSSTGLITLILMGFSTIWLLLFWAANHTGKGGITNLNLILGIAFIMIPIANLVLGLRLLWMFCRVRDARSLLTICGLIAAMFPWLFFGYMALTGKLAW